MLTVNLLFRSMVRFEPPLTFQTHFCYLALISQFCRLPFYPHVHPFPFFVIEADNTGATLQIRLIGSFISQSFNVLLAILSIKEFLVINCIRYAF